MKPSITFKSRLSFLLTMLLLAVGLAGPQQPAYADDRPVSGSETLLEFEDAQTKDRYYSLLAQLRCLVCQNQSLAESDAGLAQDLRRKIHEMLQEGAGDEQIIDFMVARYGDFVLYNPPLKASTVLLWFGPFILAGFGILWLVVYLVRRNEQKAESLLSEARRRRAAELLNKSRNNHQD